MIAALADYQVVSLLAKLARPLLSGNPDYTRRGVWSDERGRS